MIIEIERKYLINLEKLGRVDLMAASPKQYTQVYLSVKPAVRVTCRKSFSQDGTISPLFDKAWLTVKSAGSLSRQEFEYDIPVEDGLKMLPLSDFKITKTRYRVPTVGSDHVWEIDQYTGKHAGLWTAEIELKHESEEVLLPEWIGQEVTYDSRYSNVNIAVQGLPKGS